MTKTQVEVITSVQRRRRWSRTEKERIVAAALEPGVVASESFGGFPLLVDADLMHSGRLRRLLLVSARPNVKRLIQAGESQEHKVKRQHGR